MEVDTNWKARAEAAEARVKELETRDANVAYEARTAARDIARDRADKAEARCAAATEVMHWAQAILTALNVGDIQQESPLHKKLRQVMIEFRAERDALAAAEGKP